MRKRARESGSAPLSERIAFRCTEVEADGANWLVKKAREAMEAQYPKLAGASDSITVATVMRDLLRRELVDRRWERAPEIGAPLVEPKAQVDDEQERARRLLERCVDAGFQMSEVADLVGIDGPRLSHFRHNTPGRGKLPADRLARLVEACTAWLDEHARGSKSDR